MSEQGAAGRYTRSFNGMVGAMVFTVALVVVLVLFRTLISDPPDGSRPEALENYRESVQGLQQAGFDLVHPASLPEGWVVTEVAPVLDEEPSFRINLYTADDEFVGIRQDTAEAADAETLLEEYVDEDPDAEDPLTGVGEVAATWEGWSDDGGDRAYTAEVDGDAVIVFGSVPFEDLQALVAELTTAEVTSG